ncbi:MAG: ComZ family protein [Bacillus sp. (in: firmicutes)]
MPRNLEKEFMKIALKHFPEGQEKLKSLGIDVSWSMVPVLSDLFLKMMQEAYELGKREAK